MALLIAKATGDFSNAASWGTTDTTMVKTDGATATEVTTSNLDSSSYTPGAITTEGVLLNMAERDVSPTGTCTVTLRNSTAGVDITSITFNISDLPVMETANTTPGCWIFVKWSTPQLLIVATNYLIRITASVSNQFRLYAGASNNWNLVMRTSTTAAPGANDRLFVQPEITGTGTSNSIVVTMDNNATTDFGKIDVTGLNGVTGAIRHKTSAATQIRTSGFLDIWAGGEYSVGTTGNPVPIGTAAILEMDCTSNNEFTIRVRQNGTFNAQGTTKNYWKTLLAADAAAAATSLTVADSIGTNWKNGDSLVLAPTTRTATEVENKALTADGSGTTLTIAAITNAHSGTSPTQGHVVNLSRDVKVRSVSASFASTLDIRANGIVDIDWVEMPRVAHTCSSSSVNVQYSSIYTTLVANTSAVFIGSNVAPTYSNNILYNTGTGSTSYGIFCNSGAAWTLDSNVAIGCSAGSGFALSDGGSWTFTNNIATGNGNKGIFPITNNMILGTFSGNTAYSNASNGLSLTGALNYIGTISNTTLWRNNASGFNYPAGTGTATNTDGAFILDGVTAFGNNTANLEFNCIIPNKIILKSLTLDAGATLTAARGVYFNGSIIPWIEIWSSTMGNTTTHSTGDIVCAGNGYVGCYMYNTKTASSTEVSGLSNFTYGSFIRSSKHDQVAGDYKSFWRLGTIQNNTSTFNTASPSEQLVPSSASFKLESAIKTVALNNGQTTTVSTYVRKSAAGANQPRLIVKAQPSAGITADTVLDTMSVGINTWEQLSGTTAAVTEDCVLEFVIDSDSGNTNVYIDDWAKTVT